MGKVVLALRDEPHPYGKGISPGRMESHISSGVYTAEILASMYSLSKHIQDEARCDRGWSYLNHKHKVLTEM